MRIARRVFFGQNLYIIEQTVSLANVFTKNRFKKTTDSPFLNQNYKLYIICVLVILQPIPYIEMIVFALFFSYQIFLVAVFASKQLSSSPGLQRSSMGPSVLRSGPPRICCLCHEVWGANWKKETAWESHHVGNSLKKRGKFLGTFFPPTHPTQLLFFPGFLLVVWWNLAWNLCMKWTLSECRQSTKSQQPMKHWKVLPPRTLADSSHVP